MISAKHAEHLAVRNEKIKTLRCKGENYADIAKRFGITAATVRGVCIGIGPARGYTRFNDNEIGQVLLMMEEGVRVPKISKELGRDPSSVVGLVKRLRSKIKNEAAADVEESGEPASRKTIMEQSQDYINALTEFHPEKEIRLLRVR